MTTFVCQDFSRIALPIYFKLQYKSSELNSLWLYLKVFILCSVLVLYRKRKAIFIELNYLFLMLSKVLTLHYHKLIQTFQSRSNEYQACLGEIISGVPNCADQVAGKYTL